MIRPDEVARLLPELPLESSALDRLNQLGKRFLDHGSQRGVTALKSSQAIKEEFLLDSLAAATVLPTRGKVIDIGTGGGVPGLVMALARPDLEFVLADSAQKKTRWVEETVAELAIPNVEVRTGRLEALGRDAELRGAFSAVTAKALAPLPVLLEFSMPLLEQSGRLVALKGPALEEEIRQARKALAELLCRVHRCWGYRIGEKVYRVCEVIKFGPTPDRYPRRDGVPQKKPL